MDSRAFGEAQGRLGGPSRPLAGVVWWFISDDVWRCCLCSDAALTSALRTDSRGCPGARGGVTAKESEVTLEEAVTDPQAEGSDHHCLGAFGVSALHLCLR